MVCITLLKGTVCGEQGVSLCDKSLHILETSCCKCQISVRLRSINMRWEHFDGLFSVDCSIAYTKMFLPPRLLILLVASSDIIPVVALPAPTRVPSSAARLVYHHKGHDIDGQTRSSFFYAFCH